MTKPSVSWMQEPWTAFDTETTGVDVENDFILSAAIVPLRNPASTFYWLLNWEVDIPPEAAKIHGLTREYLSLHGGDPKRVLRGIVKQLADGLRDGVLVGMNIAFDLTMLDRNCRAIGIPPLSDAATHADLAPIADAFVLDKYVDPFRKGKRNLTALTEHYEVAMGEGGAHNAQADAIAAARVLWRLGKLYPNIGAMDPLALHQLQVAEKRMQDESFRRYLLSKGQDATGVDGIWPIKPYQEA